MQERIETMSCYCSIIEQLVIHGCVRIDDSSINKDRPIQTVAGLNLVKDCSAVFCPERSDLNLQNWSINI